MILILLLNGHIDNIVRVHKLDPSNIKTVKIDEKKLASPGFMKSLIKAERYEKIYFACRETVLQRFHTFMKFYIFISDSKKGAIIDETGDVREFGKLKLFFREIPMLFVEIIASAFIVIIYYIKLPIIRWRMLKKN